MSSDNAKSLPRIIRFLGTVDCGADGQGACPHCGAQGRYIHQFECEDGTVRGAMSGCIKLFRMHPFARVMFKIEAKERKYASKGWKLSSWDIEERTAIEAFYAGSIPEASVKSVLDNVRDRRKSYVRQRYGRG